MLQVKSLHRHIAHEVCFSMLMCEIYVDDLILVLAGHIIAKCLWECD